MGEIAHAEKALEHALKRTHATVKKKDNRGRNRTFKAWTVAALLEQYRDPRAILLEIAGMDTKALANEMQCSLIDALAERRLAAMCVLPYVAQKLPAQVDMRLTRAINLNIVDDRQYQELVEIAAEATDDTDTFSMQLLSGQAASEDVTSERPVTPPTPGPSREAE